MKTTHLSLLKKFFNNVGKFRREISEIRKQKLKIILGLYDFSSNSVTNIRAESIVIVLNSGCQQISTTDFQLRNCRECFRDGNFVSFYVGLHQISASACLAAEFKCLLISEFEGAKKNSVEYSYGNVHQCTFNTYREYFRLLETPTLYTALNFETTKVYQKRTKLIMKRSAQQNVIAPTFSLQDPMRY